MVGQHLGMQAGAHDRHQKSGRHAVTRDVSDGDRHLMLSERQEIEVIAAHLGRRFREEVDVQASRLGGARRQHRLLNPAGRRQLAAHPLLLAKLVTLPVELVQHEVEGMRELSELIHAILGHPSREIAFRRQTGA
ncbi:hypothetical protein D3C86_960340 [compost metagenome]